MIKKILTTKPHLVVFFLGLIALIYTATRSYFGTWNLNRTIGWGWDITNFIWWIMPSGGVSIIFFAFVFWILKIRRCTFLFELMFFQIIVIVLFLISIIQFQYVLSEGLLFSNWLLFFANIIAAIYSKKDSGY